MREIDSINTKHQNPKGTKDLGRLPSEPKFIQETPDSIFGREFYPVTELNTWIPNESVLAWINELNHPENDQDRKTTVFKLNNNTPIKLTNDVGFERPLSAYFTYKPEGITEIDNYFKEAIIIEWGKIDPKKGDAKLHDVLNKSITGINQRKNQGMKLSSGHFAKRLDGNGYIALLDDISCFDNEGNQKKIDKNSPTGKMINTMYQNGIIPLSADGYVLLPAFTTYEHPTSSPQEHTVFERISL